MRGAPRLGVPKSIMTLCGGQSVESAWEGWLEDTTGSLRAGNRVRGSLRARIASREANSSIGARATPPAQCARPGSGGAGNGVATYVPECVSVGIRQENPCLVGRGEGSSAIQAAGWRQSALCAGYTPLL